MRLQAYQFELRPSGEQLRNLRQFAGSCRFVYNKALALNTERYNQKEKHLGYARLCALLPNWKREHPFLSEVPAQALQQALKNLERAYSNFFQKRAEFPKFKKKGQRESFRVPQGFAVDNGNGRIKLPKIGWMRYRKSQEVLGEAKNVTIRESGGKWFIAVQTEREVATPLHESTSMVGLDWGIVRFYTLSGRIPRAVPAAQEVLAEVGEVAAPYGSEEKVFKQLEESESRYRQVAPAHCQHQKRFPTPVLERHQQKPRGGVCRGPASKEYVQVQQRQEGPAGEATTLLGSHGRKAGIPECQKPVCLCVSCRGPKMEGRPRQVIRSSAFIPLPQTFASSFAYAFLKGLMSPEGFL